MRATGTYITDDQWYWLSRDAGQQLFYPPNVSGWDDNRWLDTNTMRGRWLCATEVLDDHHAEVWDESYDPTETPEPAVDKALGVWDYPPLRKEQQNELVHFSNNAFPGSLANWQQIAYRGAAPERPPPADRRLPRPEPLLGAPMAHDHCHCRDYTRSQLLRRAAAPGRQGPARDRERDAAAGGHRALPPLLPLPQRGPGARRLRRHQAAAERLRGGHRPRATPPKVLVSIFFDGGIDALNVLAPINDSRYQDLRPTLALPSGLGPSPRTRASSGIPRRPQLRTLHGEDKVTVFPAIGYTSPNQSHFTSRHYYEIGEVQVGANTGWLGRYIEQVGSDDNPLQGLSLSNELSPMLATPSKPVAAVESVTDYDLWSWADDEPVQSNMFDELRQPRGACPRTRRR